MGITLQCCVPGIRFISSQMLKWILLLIHAGLKSIHTRKRAPRYESQAPQKRVLFSIRVTLHVVNCNTIKADKYRIMYTYPSRWLTALHLVLFNCIYVYIFRASAKRNPNIWLVPCCSYDLSVMMAWEGWHANVLYIYIITNQFPRWILLN